MKSSSHLLGYAIDWKDITDAELIRFLDAAWDAGFRRFGIMANRNTHRRRPDQDKPGQCGRTTQLLTPVSAAKVWFAGKNQTEMTQTNHDTIRLPEKQGGLAWSAWYVHRSLHAWENRPRKIGRARKPTFTLLTPYLHHFNTSDPTRSQGAFARWFGVNPLRWALRSETDYP